MRVQILALSVGLAFSTLAAAQDRTLTRSVIPGGGGKSSGSRFSVRGAIGQADANVTRMTGARFTVDGGLHSIIQALQTPGGPHLNMSVLGNQVILAWPAESDDWILQQSAALGPSANWTDSTGVSNNRLTTALPGGNRFYRLRRSEP